jgi:hypothetical protein
MPYHSHLEADAQPLPAGEFSLARVEMFPFAHVVRPGSRLRINVEVPGGNQPFWQTDPLTFAGPVTNDIAHTAGMPSRIVLPLVAGASTPNVPDALPPCPGLRGQACRAYLPPHLVTGVTAVADGPDIDVDWVPHFAQVGTPIDEVGAPADQGIPFAAAPTGFRIDVAPTGESFEVGPDVTTFTYPDAAPDTRFSFTVTAQYEEGVAPTSDASLSVLIQSPTPESTTTTTAPTTTTTAGPASSTTTVAGATSADPGSVTAAGVTTSSSGSLPITGAAIALFVVIAVALLAVGIVLAIVARRRKP